MPISFLMHSGLCLGLQIQKVLCSWHIDRSWRGALRQYIKQNEKRIKIYHYLRVLLMKGTKPHLVKKILTFLDENREGGFLSYFKKTYCNQTQQWAACHRLGTQANTNMFVESFHRLLKTDLQQKQNRRVDYLVHTLLHIADKAYERLQKKHKGKYSHRISEINKRHKLAETMLAAGATPEFDTNHWKVTSERDASQFYWVTKVLENGKNCELICASCNMCSYVLMYLS